MKMEKTPDRRGYYQDGESWSQDVNGALRASRRTAWIVASGAAVVAVVEALALVAMAPLKTVVPYTITVDRQTGFLQVAQGLKPGALSQNAAVTQAFLVQYVLARETFDRTDAQTNYREVAAWTAGPAHDQFIRFMAKTNPQSPVNVYTPSTIMQVTVRGVSMLSPTSAIVRFDAERSDGGATPASRQPYAAVIAFRYTGRPMRNEDRYLNPLGFQVTFYRRDAESVSPAPLSQVTP